MTETTPDIQAAFIPNTAGLTFEIKTPHGRIWVVLHEGGACTEVYSQASAYGEMFTADGNSIGSVCVCYMGGIPHKEIVP